LKSRPQASIPNSLLILVDEISLTQQNNRKNLDQLLTIKKEEITRLQAARDENKELLEQLQRRLEERRQEMLFEKQEISVGPSLGQLKSLLCKQCFFGGCLWSSGYRLGLWPTEYLQ
jgi:hypothetical protein